MTNSIPPSWTMAKLGDIAKINPRLDVIPDDSDIVSFVPMKSVEAETGIYNLSDNRQFISVKKGFTLFQNFDLIFAKITPCMENGKIALLNHLHNDCGAGSTEFHVIRSNKLVVNSKLLFFFIVQKTFRINAQKSMKGSAGQLRVPTDYLINYPIPLPPLAEQQRIVAKLEELFSQLDTAVAGLKKAKEQIKIYKQAVLSAAFKGELTSARGELTIDNGQLTSTMQNAECRMQNEETGLPEGWIWVKLGEVIELLTDYHANGGYETLRDNVQLLDNPDYSIMIRTKNLTRQDFSDDLKYISKSAYNFLSKSKLFGGEIIIGKIGNAGQIYWMPKLNKICSLGMNMFMIRLKQNYLSRYFYLHLLSPYSQKNISNYIKGVGNPTIDKKSIRNLNIAIPNNLNEQEQIVSEIEARFSEADNLGKNIDMALEQAESLRQSILKKAFEGRLVPQNPSDEAAAKLLERIRKEKLTTTM